MLAAVTPAPYAQTVPGSHRPESPAASPSGPTSPLGSRGPHRFAVQGPRQQFQQQQKMKKQQQKAAAAAASDSDSGYDNRPRRRFVKPTVTTYETCFSRNATNPTSSRRYNRRSGSQPRFGLAAYAYVSSGALAAGPTSPTYHSSQQPHVNGSTVDDAGFVHPTPLKLEGVRRAPAVSSLSSALQEVMHGRQRALSSYVDATGPPPPRTFVVQQDEDGALFVVSSERAAKQTAAAQTTQLPASDGYPLTIPQVEDDDQQQDLSSSMRRSDLDFSRSRKWPTRRSHRRDSVESNGGGGKSSKVKLLGFSKIKSKLALHRTSLIGRGSLGNRDRPMTMDEMAPAVLGGTQEGHLSFHAAEEENLLPMLDSDLVDARGRGDSSWEVPAVPLPVARTGPPPPPAPPAVDKSKIVNRPIPWATAGAFDDDDDDDEAMNPLNRSFLNVRDIEFNPRTAKETPVSVPADALDARSGDEEVEDEDEEDEIECENQNSNVNAALQHERATFDTSDRHATASVSSTSRGQSFSGGPVAGVRVSNSGVNVSEFLGGFKGQLSTRRASLGQDGFVNRTRSVRNGVRKNAAALAANQAANAAAAQLTRKLLEARDRIPPELREDAPLPAKRHKKNRKPRVRWDMTLYCREFEVESEDEEAAQLDIVKAPWEYRDSEERESDEESDDDHW